MKPLILALSLLAASAPALAQTSVSIAVGQPGFYGRLDLGDFGRPNVVYEQPVMVERHTRYVAEPMYLRVPPGHMKHWSKHCRQYNACGRQVYFVRDDWYQNTYAPRYREIHGGRGRGQGAQHRGDERGDRDEHRGNGRGNDRDHGPGQGHDKGHDKGHGNGHGHD